MRAAGAEKMEYFITFPASALVWMASLGALVCSQNNVAGARKHAKCTGYGKNPNFRNGKGLWSKPPRFFCRAHSQLVLKF